MEGWLYDCFVDVVFEVDFLFDVGMDCGVGVLIFVCVGSL